MQDTQIQSHQLSTVIWLLLFVLTIATFSIGEAGISSKEAMLGLLAITMIKSQMVANYFMGLRKTRLLWRGIMLGYFLIVSGLIALAYVMALA